MFLNSNACDITVTMTDKNGNKVVFEKQSIYDLCLWFFNNRSHSRSKGAFKDVKEINISFSRTAAGEPSSNAESEAR